MKTKKQSFLARAAMTLLLIVLTTMTAWAGTVTLTEDTEETTGTAARWYVNMSKSGTNTLTLADASITSFKVYDNGGKSGNYSNSCDGAIVLNAPDGYVLQLFGTIKTEMINDRLTVYDNNEASGTKLIDGVSSASHGAQTAITTVTSMGQSMTIFFHSDSDNNHDGLDLIVTLVSTSTPYTITVNEATGGSVAASVAGNAATGASVNESVTLTASAADGYVLSNINVVDANSNSVEVTWNVWSNSATFTMPNSNVTVTPTFTNDLTTLYVNMPKTGSKLATIPAGVQSFKVYDDGGATGNYSDYCSGTLVLTAPMGYVLQLSGTIDLEKYDNLTVYDNNEASGTKLLDAVSNNTTINTDLTSGQSMTLYFYSDRNGSYSGLDLTVTLVSTSTTHNITVYAVAGGSVVASVEEGATTTAKVNETVTLTASPTDGYVLSDISVVDANSKAVKVTDMRWYADTNTATFAMPNSNVTVTPTFTNNLTANGGLYVDMPKTGSKQATIPEGVQSFKVYDDGGATGNHSDNYRGTLVLTAPEGYVLQLSGNIMTEYWDNLTVYDNNKASGTKLLDNVHSSAGAQMAITTVTGSGKSMTICFSSDASTNYAGLDLAVTVMPNSTYVNITLANDDSQAATKNSALINANDGKYAVVTLQGRTLYKDGDWNTLCLPFDVTLANSPLAGATVKKLTTSTSKMEGSTLTLNFEDETTKMTAGTPYLVKWTKANDYVDDNDHNLVNPVFTGVTIDNTMHDANFDGGSFKGTYSSIAWNADDQSILFLGAQNKLYWPKSGASLGAQRAYFQLDNGTQASEFVLNFDGDGETTGVIEVNEVKEVNEVNDNSWYTLNGVKLDSKPNKPGLYINNGKKVVIK